ncbi:MAG: DIP1984 family protein [Thermomicrobiales bacterium]
MVKLAEALLRRKDLGARQSDLQSEIYNSLFAYEGEGEDGPDVGDLLREHQELSDVIFTLTVNINRTNNMTPSGYNDLSLMEAIAYRDSLLRTSQLLGNVAAQVSSPGTSAFGGVGGRRTKDDLKVVARYDKKVAASMRNAAAEQLRRLEVAIQKTNWTAELQEIE